MNQTTMEILGFAVAAIAVIGAVIAGVRFFYRMSVGIKDLQELRGLLDQVGAIVKAVGADNGTKLVTKVNQLVIEQHQQSLKLVELDRKQDAHAYFHQGSPLK